MTQKFYSLANINTRKYYKLNITNIRFQIIDLLKHSSGNLYILEFLNIKIIRSFHLSST